MAVSHNYYRWEKANGKLYNFMDDNCIWLNKKNAYAC